MGKLGICVRIGGNSERLKGDKVGQHDRGLSPHITQLRPWHRSMVRAVAAGQRPKDLAVMFGYTEAMISRIINSPLFKAELERMEAEAEVAAVDINVDLKLMAKKAVEILDEEMHSIDQIGRKLRVSTAFGVLDRAGYAKKDTPLHLHKHDHVHVGKMTTEELYRDVIDLTQSDEVEDG